MICLNKPKMNMGKKFRFYSSHCSYLKILGKIYQVFIQFLNMHVRLHYKKNHCAVVSIHTINTVLKGAQRVMFPGQSSILVYQTQRWGLRHYIYLGVTLRLVFDIIECLYCFKPYERSKCSNYILKNHKIWRFVYDKEIWVNIKHCSKLLSNHVWNKNITHCNSGYSR